MSRIRLTRRIGVNPNLARDECLCRVPSRYVQRCASGCQQDPVFTASFRVIVGRQCQSFRARNLRRGSGPVPRRDSGSVLDGTLFGSVMIQGND
jgi:hypothetical protein